MNIKINSYEIGIDKPTFFIADIAANHDGNLELAKELIGKDRQDDYGDKLTNHKNIAALWSIFLRKKITAHDVAMCMALVKVARLMHAHKKDSYIDLAAYAAIAGELNERDK